MEELILLWCFATKKLLEYEALSCLKKNGRVTSHLNLLPTEKLQDEFMGEVVDAYLKQHPLARDGACFIKYTYGKIFGKK